MIRGVTFDWWHTVAETPWPDWDDRMRVRRVERIREALAGKGLVLPLEDLYRAYDRHTELLVGTWRNRVDLSAEEQVRAFLGFLGLDGADPDLQAVVQEAFGRALETDPPVLYPHVPDVLARLQSEGYRIGLVSNTGRTWGRYLRRVQDRLGIGSYFDVRVFSDEVGVRKPDPRIFTRALEALRLRPDEVVHVGDDVEADVAGAKALGMRAIWFNAGFWPEAQAGPADAEIHDHEDLVAILGRWPR